MAKFKVGDRVRVTDKSESEYNKTGTVIEPSRSPWVAFDERTDYGGEESNRAGWVAGHMDCVSEDQLELANPPIHLTLDAAVAAYTLACEAFEAAELAVEKAKGDVADAKIALRDALDGEG